MKYFLLLVILSSCTQYRTISYQQAKSVDGKLVTDSAIVTKKVPISEIHWIRKSNKFTNGQTINLIVR